MSTTETPLLVPGNTAVEVMPALRILDLVVVIDASKSMRDEAEGLSSAVSAALLSTPTRCPSDLRVTCLGIEGIFARTLFATTVRDYLTQKTGAAALALKGRPYTWVAGGKVREDGARSIEDVSLLFDWRPHTERAVLLLSDEGLDGGGQVDAKGIAAATRAITTARASGVRVHTYLGTTRARGREALESEYARLARETGGQAFTRLESLSGYQGMLERVICGSRSELLAPEQTLLDRPPAGVGVPMSPPGSTPTAGTTSYTFRVLEADGALFGKGCFTHEGPATQTPITLPTAGGPALTAFWYHDSIVGSRELQDVRAFTFTPGQFSLELSTPDPTRDLKAGSASVTQPGVVARHSDSRGDYARQNRTLEYPRYAEPTTTTGEGQGVIPVVDLVVVIDASKSMRDEADRLSSTVSTAIKAARASCPSDLRVTYLGIEGAFAGTLFGTTVRDYMAQQVGVDMTTLRGRPFTWVAGGKVREDGARAIEDVSAHFDWRPGAQRALFFLGDEALEAGGRKVGPEDIAAATRALETARRSGVRVHTYLGTTKARGWELEALKAEYARVARETKGQAFTAMDSLSGFQGLLEKIICASKSDPRVTTQEFCCCQAVVADFLAPLPIALPVAVPVPVPIPVPPAATGASSGVPRWVWWLLFWLLLLGLLLFLATRLPVPGPSKVTAPVPAPLPVPPPKPAPASSEVVIEKGRLRTIDKVFFATDKDNALAESLPILDQVVEVLKVNPDIKRLRIEAHTDNASSAAYNQELSTRRAEWVKQYLIQKGVAAERLESAGFGITRPIDTNDTAEGRANNRRVEFVIVE